MVCEEGFGGEGGDGVEGVWAFAERARGSGGVGPAVESACESWFGGGKALDGAVIDECVGRDTQGAECGGESAIARGAEAGDGAHAAVFEAGAVVAHGGDGFGADGEGAAEVGADESGGDALTSVARMDDDAGDAADFGVELACGFALRESRVFAGPGGFAPVGVERWETHGEDADEFFGIFEFEPGAEDAAGAGGIACGVMTSEEWRSLRGCAGGDAKTGGGSGHGETR